METFRSQAFLGIIQRMVNKLKIRLVENSINTSMKAEVEGSEKNTK